MGSDRNWIHAGSRSSQSCDAYADLRRCRRSETNGPERTSWGVTLEGRDFSRYVFWTHGQHTTTPGVPDTGSTLLILGLGFPVS